MRRRKFISLALKPASTFFKHESSTGILLFVCAVIAIVWANSPLKESYHNLWYNYLTIRVAGFEVSKTFHHWINDGLMSVFFFVVGLELKREIVGGELSSLKKAILPFGAAMGGMIIPALIYTVFNFGQDTQRGWGIPMATDIAFALGVLLIIGKRVPVSLKLFLTALAIADDLGAVLTIAFFYTSEISFTNLLIGAAFLATLITANLLGIRKSLFYAVIGIGGLWLAFLLSGVHATIAGVLAAFTIPARAKIDEVDYAALLRKFTSQFEKSPPDDTPLVTKDQFRIMEDIRTASKHAVTPLQRLEHIMHPLVSFVVIPIFALSNAGIDLSNTSISTIINPVTLGVALGLILGKFLGIAGFSYILVKAGVTMLPTGLKWKHICGVSLLAGMGFSMSLFISALAFNDNTMIENAKLGILIASALSALGGFIILWKAGAGPRPKI
jgi:Na+:H+ antiporter, NhaA family